MIISAPNDLVAIGYIALFQNSNASNATGAENGKSRPNLKFLNF